MSNKFKVVQRLDPRDRTLPGKYYAEQTDRYVINFDELLGEITTISTVSIGDTYNVLHTLIQQIKKHLQEGRILRVGELGTFYTTIKSEGKESQDEVDASTIKKVFIRFRPGVKLKEAIKNLKFQRVRENGAPPGA